MPDAGLQVADVRLHGADAQHLARGAVAGEHGAERLGLDRIADRRAGAVRLDVVRRRPDATPARPVAPSRSTACWASRPGTVMPFVRPSWLTALPRDDARRCGRRRRAPCERLEHDDARALAAHVAVGLGRSNALQRPSAARASTPCRSRSSAPAFSIACTPPASASVALAVAQALAGQVHGHQRRRARGVDDRSSGPRRSKTYEMRLAAMLRRRPSSCRRRSERGCCGYTCRSP